MQTFETTGPVRARVDTPYGTVDVATHDAPRAEVDVQALRDDDASREAVEQTRVELTPSGDLRVEVPKRHGSFFGRDPWIRIDLRLPEGSSLAFSTASADVTTTGRLGDVRGRTASGDVTIADADAVRVDTASGDLRADEVRGDAELKSASGEVRLGRVGGRLVASAVSGDVRVASAESGATASAVSGDIELDRVAGGDVSVRSVSGDVRVGIAEGSRVHVDVTTLSGDLSSDVELGDGPGDDSGPLVNVSGKTVSGDVRIRRATAAGV
jgi:hypothetical protein